MRDVRRAIAFAALSIAGVVAGSVIATSLNSTGGISPRVASSNSEETFGQRFMAWREGLARLRPSLLIGAGPGQFRSVTSFLFPLSFVKPSPGEVFTDAHNFIVEYLTTTGILGAVALLLWLARRSCQDVARAARSRPRVVLIAMELAEPLNAAVFPVALAAARCGRSASS